MELWWFVIRYVIPLLDGICNAHYCNCNYWSASCGRINQPTTMLFLSVNCHNIIPPSSGVIIIEHLFHRPAHGVIITEHSGQTSWWLAVIVWASTAYYTHDSYSIAIAASYHRILIFRVGHPNPNWSTRFCVRWAYVKWHVYLFYPAISIHMAVVLLHYFRG